MKRLYQVFNPLALKPAFVALCLLTLVACASIANQSTKLDQAQYAWSGAIRWGDFEGAANLIDPKRSVSPHSRLSGGPLKPKRVTRESGSPTHLYHATRGQKQLQQQTEATSRSHREGL